MSKIFITVTGTRYFHGTDFLQPGMKLTLVKEPDNQYDKEAILVNLKGLGAIGHVANSVRTVLGDCMSAGRLYDRIGDTAQVKVMYVLPTGVICKVCKKSLIGADHPMTYPSYPIGPKVTTPKNNETKRKYILDEDDALSFN